MFCEIDKRVKNLLQNGTQINSINNLAQSNNANSSPSLLEEIGRIGYLLDYFSLTWTNVNITFGEMGL